MFQPSETIDWQFAKVTTPPRPTLLAVENGCDNFRSVPRVCLWNLGELWHSVKETWNQYQNIARRYLQPTRGKKSGISRQNTRKNWDSYRFVLQKWIIKFCESEWIKGQQRRHCSTKCWHTIKGLKKKKKAKEARQVGKNTLNERWRWS